METVLIDNRHDFEAWAIQRAQDILRSEGAAFAIAADDGSEEALEQTAAILAKAISDAMVDVFDSLVAE